MSEPIKEKPFWKKFKFMVAIGTILLDITAGIVGLKNPEAAETVMTIGIEVTTLAIVLIGGHAYTDAKAALSRKD